MSALDQMNHSLEMPSSDDQKATLLTMSDVKFSEQNPVPSRYVVMYSIYASDKKIRCQVED